MPIEDLVGNTELLKRVLEHYRYRLDNFTSDEEIKPLISGPVRRYLTFGQLKSLVSEALIELTKDRDKWGLKLQVLLPEAIIATRLAFRPPERVSPASASRLNRFIKHIGNVDWSMVNAFIDAFELRTVVRENLAGLRAKKISINGASKIMRGDSR